MRFFEHGMPDTFIHNYKIVHDKDSQKIISGLHFTFIELPKFHPQSMQEKRMAVLWLRFLTEINSSTEQVPEELTENPEISKALEELKVTAFSEEELRAYNKFWDSVRVEKTLQHDSYKKGQDDEKFAIAQKMLLAKLPDAQIIAFTGLPQEQINRLKN